MPDTHYYDSVGRLWRNVEPDGSSVTNEFFATGQTKKTYGTRTCPVEYTYDYAGRMKTMVTWRDCVGGGAGWGLAFSAFAVRLKTCPDQG